IGACVDRPCLHEGSRTCIQRSASSSASSDPCVTPGHAIASTAPCKTCRRVTPMKLNMTRPDARRDIVLIADRQLEEEESMQRALRVFAVSVLSSGITIMAHAGGSDTSSIACGSSSSGWSAPKGSLVSNYGAGPVKAVLQALGETRTHQILSHGPGGWA